MLRVFAILLLIHAVAWFLREPLPLPSQIDPTLASDPVQAPTARMPFEVVRGGVTYRIKPLAEYELRGLVVSYHDSDSFLDIHHGLWGDKLNFRDLGVVWGHNALSGIYREIRFASQDFTLSYSCADRRVWSRFRMDQVSNNHLLAADRGVERDLRAVGRGDQVVIRGALCAYSHPGGTRGTSLSRRDRGNGACETVFVDSVVVLRESGGGWRVLSALSGFLIKLAIPFLLWQAWMALRSRPEEVAAGLPGAGAPPEPSLPLNGAPACAREAPAFDASPAWGG